MGHPDGAHTHGSGGSGLGPVVLVILAVALLGPAVTAAAVALLHLLVIAARSSAASPSPGGAAVVAVRVHRWRADGVTRMSLHAPPPWRPVEARTPPRQVAGQPPVAIERPQEIHLHLHGVSAEDLAAIIERQEK